MEDSTKFQQYYESLASSQLEETREIIAKYYPNYQTLLNYALDGYTPDFAEHTDSHIIISQLEDVCAEFGAYYTEQTESRIDLTTLEVQKDSYETSYPSEEGSGITVEETKDNVHDLKTELKIDKRNPIGTSDNKEIKKEAVAQSAKVTTTNLYRIPNSEINKLTFAELIHAFAVFLYPASNYKRETYEFKYRYFDSLKPWLRGQKSLRDFSNYFCAGRPLDKAAVLFDKVLSWVESNFKARVLSYSESMSQLLDNAYEIKNSDLSPDIQKILVNSCTSKDVLDKVSRNEVTINDLLLICNKDEYLQIRKFLYSHYKRSYTSILKEDHNSDAIKTETKHDLLNISTADISKMSYKELISAFAMYLYPKKKHMWEIYEYRFQDLNILKPYVRGEKTLSEFAKDYCNGATLDIASLLFEEILRWVKSHKEVQDNDDVKAENEQKAKQSSIVVKTLKGDKEQNNIRGIKTTATQETKKKVITSVSQLDEYGQKAAQLVREGNNLFITGKAGTGKSTVLRALVQEAKEIKKNVVVLAPTGVAAKVAKGMTIHSFLHLPLGPYIPKHRIRGLYSLSDVEIEIVKKLDIIFIDEVSMVRCDLLDEIDDVLRHYRGNKSPFGGVQVVMFGDLFQLMPVANDDDKEKLSKAYNTESLYFFNAKVYKDMDCKTFELMKIYRQAENDFKELLNNVREGHVAPYEIKKLESRYRKSFNPSDSEGYIRLTTHNYRANKYNKERLENLPGELYDFKASILKGYVPKDDWPTDYHLELKSGARVMFLRNDPAKRFVNGTLGTVTKLTDYSIRVKTDGGIDIDVDKCNWDFYKYKMNKQTKEIEPVLMGTFRQYPLRLAWAVTIHKSQGMQFPKVIIDAGHAFAYGQVYVALSRCEVFHNIFLVSKITSKIIQTDPIVKDFMRNATRINVDGEITEEKEYENEHHSHLTFDPLKDTLWMVKDGLSIDDMIKQSNEPSGIIYGRLIKLIKQRDVDIKKLLSPEKYRLIKRAFDKLGHKAAPKEIKTLCPNCNYGEINLVKASLSFQ